MALDLAHLLKNKLFVLLINSSIKTLYPINPTPKPTLGFTLILNEYWTSLRADENSKDLKEIIVVTLNKGTAIWSDLGT